MRRQTLVFASLVAAAAAIVPAARAAAADCPVVLVRSPQERPGFTIGTARVSAAAAIDVEFDVLLTRFDDREHLLQLRLHLPTGDLYQTIDVPLTADTGTPLRSVSGKAIEGYPHPVPRTRPGWFTLGLASYRVVRVPFPVAGTAIVHNSLHGRWTVETYLDGAETPCGPAASFVIGR